MSKVNNYDQALTPQEQEIADSVDPRGFRILLKAVIIPEKVGSIMLPDDYQKFEKRVYNVGRVLAMGEMCYTPLGPSDTDKFRVPFCEIGDWVHFSGYEKEDIYICDQLCYYLNDERVHGPIRKLENVVKELRIVKHLG